MKVFLDNNLSPYLARGLNALLEPEDDEIVHLSEKFARGVDDRTWIEALGAEGGWVVISADRRIYRNPLEREAWRRARLVVFFLGRPWAKATNIETAWRLLRWWPRIREQVGIVAAPAAFELPFGFGSGRLKVLRS